MNAQVPSEDRVDPLTERLRFLSPTAKYKFAKDQYYMVGEVMHEAAHEIERLQRELDGANKTIAHFMGPEGEKYIDRFAAMLSGPVSLEESIRKYSASEPRAATGTVLATLRDLRHVAEASGRTVSLSADNILDVLAEIDGRDRRIAELERASQPPPVACGPELAHAMDKLGAIVNGQSERITPLEANALLINWRQLQADARAAPPLPALPPKRHPMPGPDEYVIRIDGAQIKQLAGAVDDDETSMVLRCYGEDRMEPGKHGEPMPAGLYAWYEDLPEEGQLQLLPCSTATKEAAP